MGRPWIVWINQIRPVITPGGGSGQSNKIYHRLFILKTDTRLTNRIVMRMNALFLGNSGQDERDRAFEV